MSKLCLPDHKMWLDAETILHRFFTKTAVGNLHRDTAEEFTSYPLALFADLKISRLVAVSALFNHLSHLFVMINQHCMTVTECCSRYSNTGRCPLSNIKSWSAQSNDIHHLSELYYAAEPWIRRLTKSKSFS